MLFGYHTAPVETCIVIDRNQASLMRLDENEAATLEGIGMSVSSLGQQGMSEHDARLFVASFNRSGVQESNLTF
ncbi:MAG: hypothetical protein KKB70_08540 [Proteobacteria bacterium]|nr:hypothetical protein [Pseudomonadota bacterium]